MNNRALGMVRGAEGPKIVLCEPGAHPLVGTDEIDVLLAEWGEKLEQLRVESLPAPS